MVDNVLPAHLQGNIVNFGQPNQDYTGTLPTAAQGYAGPLPTMNGNPLTLTQAISQGWSQPGWFAPANAPTPAPGQPGGPLPTPGPVETPNIFAGGGPPRDTSIDLGPLVPKGDTTAAYIGAPATPNILGAPSDMLSTTTPTPNIFDQYGGGAPQDISDTLSGGSLWGDLAGKQVDDNRNLITQTLLAKQM